MFSLKDLLLGLVVVNIFSRLQVNSEWHDGAGPWVIATEGEPWPLPFLRELDNYYYQVDHKTFRIQIMQENCDILEEAVNRYKQIIKKESRTAKKLAHFGKIPDAERKSTFLDSTLIGLDIYLKNKCESYPQITSNELYELNIPTGDSTRTASLSSGSIWGILRGLETFSQLLVPSKNGSAGLTVRSQKIVDRPRLPHRGLLLDTSRHYIPMSDILLTLDAMAYNKLNVFHWHIVDDNSFPYESAVFPELSSKGAYHPTMIYTADDIKKVIEYARFRGIRVLPEFDTPGHTQSWGLSHPEFLTPCYGTDEKPTGKLGPMNPTTPSLYPFLKSLFTEVGQRYPDQYIHLGGDEVPYECWQSNPEIRQFMQKNNISQKYEKLEELYIQRVLDIVNELKTKPIVWQEVFDNGVKMHEGTVVHVWTGNWRGKMFEVTAAGHPVLLSTCWYLDHVASGGDWLKYYNCDPLDFAPSSQNQANLVLGGEACMWTEFVDNNKGILLDLECKFGRASLVKITENSVKGPIFRNNLHPRVWPRASAAAERLWSYTRQLDKEAEKRLEEHACRMNRRGVPAQPPNGSGFCVT